MYLHTEHANGSSTDMDIKAVYITFKYPHPDFSPDYVYKKQILYILPTCFYDPYTLSNGPGSKSLGTKFPYVLGTSRRGGGYSSLNETLDRGPVYQ